MMPSAKLYLLHYTYYISPIYLLAYLVFSEKDIHIINTNNTQTTFDWTVDSIAIPIITDTICHHYIFQSNFHYPV